MVNFSFKRFLVHSLFVFAPAFFIAQTTATFSTCGSSTWTVPACVTSISVTLEGAQGGGTAGGLGAIISGTLAVTPGQNINIVVGCQPTGVAGGAGGGGAGSNATGAGNASFGGGGASSISIGGTVLAVAGGGGGTGGGNTDGAGGNGGCPAGTNGVSPFGQGGFGASTTAGGTGGPPWISSGFAGASGTFGQGGTGGSDPCYNLGPGGGGGGGYYGGGGGGSDCFGSGSLGGGGGGGGSSLVPAGFSCAGTNTGNGVVTITYNATSATATASNTGPYCVGQTIQLNATGGGTYSWSGPGAYAATGANPTRTGATVAMSGIYTVTVTAVGGCTTTATTSVTVNPLPTPTASNTGPYCAGQTIQLNATGGGTYSWSGPGAYAATGFNPTRPASTVAMSGVYTVTVTLGTCSATATTSVTVNPVPAPTASNTGPYCAGQTIQLNATAGGTYSWNGPAAFASAAQNPSLPSATTAMSGVYTVTVTLGTCSATATTNVTVNPTPAPTATNTGPYCEGQTIQLNATAGGTYAWSGPVAYASALANPAIASSTTAMGGVYTVTVTLGTCSATATTSVTVNPLPAPAASNTGPYCLGGTVQLNATGGTTYSWSGPSAFTSAAQNPSPGVAASSMAGVYTVTVSIGTCSATATTSVVVNSALVPNISSNSPVCENAALNLTCTTTGGTYAWTGPGAYASAAQNPTINPALPANSGTYSLSVTDANGCVGTATIPVVVNPLPLVTATSATICVGQAVANLSGGGASTYMWSSGTTPSNTANVTATPTVTTTYTVTGTDANNCSNTATSTVVVNALPTVTVNSPAVCPGVIANLNAAGATTYTWTPGTTPSNLANVTANPAATTSYTVVGVDANGCIDSAVAVVTVNAQLVVNAGVDDTVCIGNNIPLNATGPAGTTYTWMPGSLAGASQSIVAASTTTFTLNAIDANGCTGSDSVLVTVPAAIVLNAGGFPATCNGVCDGQLVVLATPNTGPFSQYTYLWSGGAGTNASENGICAGNYNVTVTNNAGCTATATASVTQPVSVTAVVSGTTPASCNGVCDGSTTVTLAGGTTPYTYSWNNGSTSNNPLNLCAGTNTCNWADANGCAGTSTVTITEPAVITVSIPYVSTICIGQTATLTANAAGGNGGYQYTWTSGTVPANAATVSASPVATTSYTVSVTDVNACAPATASITVTVNPPLSVNASNNAVICVGQNTALSANASGGNGMFTYTWASGTSPGTGQNVTASPGATTTYTVTVTDGCGTPAAIDTVMVTVNPLPTLNITTDISSGCAPVCVAFTATSFPTSNTVSWTINGANTNAATGNPVNNVCFDNAGVYGASINVTDVNGCQNTFSNNNLVTVYPMPVPEFSFSPDPASVANPYVSFTDQSSGANIVSWLWNFGNPEDSTSAAQHPSFNYTGVGSYDVWLTTTTNNGCVDSIMHTVVVNPEFLIYVPNAFTPNADGVNDTFFPKGIGVDVENFEMWIYDRWGNMIWATKDWSQGWDGKVHGSQELVQQDVYVWKIKLRTWSGDKKSYVGHVTVVK